MNDIDHRAEAENTLALVAGPEGTLAEKQALIGIAQVHATLASIPTPPKMSLEQMDAQLSEHVRAQFTALRELREAVRPALGYLDQSPAGAAIADRLRELMR